MTLKRSKPGNDATNDDDDAASIIMQRVITAPQ